MIVLRRSQGSIPDKLSIAYNHFYNRPRVWLDNDSSSDKNDGEVIRIGGSNSWKDITKVVIENNIFERCNGEMEIISIKSSKNTIRFNTFKKNQGTVTLRRGENNKIVNNFFQGHYVDNTGGIRISGKGHMIANNYFHALKGSSKNYAPISILNGNAEYSNKLSGTYYEQVERLLIKNNVIVVGYGNKPYLPKSVTYC